MENPPNIKYLPLTIFPKIEENDPDDEKFDPLF